VMAGYLQVGNAVYVSEFATRMSPGVDRVSSVEDVGIAEVIDVTLEEPYKKFFANGIMVGSKKMRRNSSGIPRQESKDAVPVQDDSL
jgi:hypothetical protein